MKPLHSALIALGAGAVAAVLTTWLMAMPVFWSVAVALPVMACTLLATLLAGVAAPSWSALPVPDESLTSHQASTLSSRFAEAAKDSNRFRTRVQPRLGKLALTALRHRARDIESLNDPRARRMLGEELHTLLTNRDAQMPSPHRLAELLSRLEEK